MNIPPAFSDTYSNNPSNSQDTLTVSTDKSIYTDGDKIIVSGQVGQPVSGFPVVIRIQTPNGNLLSTKQVDASPDGQYSATINAGGSSWLEEGMYTIFAQYGIKNISAQTTFDFKKSIPQTSGQSPSASEQPQTTPSQIPQQSNPEPPMKFDLSGNNLFIILGAIIAVIVGIVIYFVSQSSKKRKAREAMLQWKRENMMQDDRESSQRDERTANVELESYKKDLADLKTLRQKELDENKERERELKEKICCDMKRKLCDQLNRELRKELKEKQSCELNRKLGEDLKGMKCVQLKEKLREEAERRDRERAEREARERSGRESRKQDDREQFKDDNQVKGSDWAYRILGLSRTCSCEEVKSKYKELITKKENSLHNMLNMSEEEITRRTKIQSDINSAREMIRDEKKCVK